ncbi:MAG TPA: SMC-Scp complex subunit ScpB [Acidobacteriaceae bacterium]|jgi:segregation and condensation protein B|nr:SMC-Scp complex subunit ScpB [Acidobacteriaceae bacterium]
MSLKAKIEAVIYASEEPVTLAQLVGLLGDEAQTELDRAVSAQQTLSLNETEADSTTQPESDASTGQATGEPTAAENEDALHAAGQAASEAIPSTPDATADQAAPEAESAGDAVATRAERARMARLRAHFRVLLDQLMAEYTTPDRGLEIREIAGGFRFATKPEYHDAVRGFVKTLKPPLKLTLQSLETLAVVAYKQPVTSPEISEIRGVDSSGVLGSLMARKLITTAGRKHVIGRPILYRTTREFLLKFGLKDVSELPSIEEFEKMAGQLAEQEEMSMGEPPESAEDRLESEGEASAPKPVVDEVIVDGRLSALPPKYDDTTEDPSAAEAEVQSDEAS